MKGVLLLSGGMDSTTLLYFLLNQGHSINAISFNYYSKHNDKELEMARWHTDRLCIKHEIVDLPFINRLYKSTLLQSGNEIPEGHYTDEIMIQTVVPFRNGILLSIATGYAETIQADFVAIASHAGDHTIYPDCRIEFNNAFQEAMLKGTHHHIRLLAPFAEWTKSQIVRLGLNLGVDYDMTWSCYKGGDRPCGKCGTCIERLEALDNNLK